MQLHATVARTFATDEVAVVGDIERHYVSSGSCCVVVNRMLGIAGFIVGLIHFDYIILVSVIHENCKKPNSQLNTKEKYLF